MFAHPPERRIAAFGAKRGEAVVVGVNRFAHDGAAAAIPIQRIEAAIEREQTERLRAFRARRDAAAVQTRLGDVRRTAEGTGNLMPALVEAVDAGATLGEICDVLRDVFGRYVAHERIA
ncbi:MAG: methylmalonyl-CoA mutase family protein [Candidatus Velthaea sp.]